MNHHPQSLENPENNLLPIEPIIIVTRWYNKVGVYYFCKQSIIYDIKFSFC